MGFVSGRSTINGTIVVIVPCFSVPGGRGISRRPQLPALQRRLGPLPGASQDTPILPNQCSNPSWPSIRLKGFHSLIIFVKEQMSPDSFAQLIPMIAFARRIIERKLFENDQHQPRYRAQVCQTPVIGKKERYGNLNLDTVTQFVLDQRPNVFCDYSSRIP